MTRRKLIAEQWASFERAVLPASASAIQRQEMRRAFYGGAASMFDVLLKNVSDSPEHTPEDDALGYDIQAELDDYVKRLGKGF